MTFSSLEIKVCCGWSSSLIRNLKIWLKIPASINEPRMDFWASWTSAQVLLISISSGRRWLHRGLVWEHPSELGLRLQESRNTESPRLAANQTDVRCEMTAICRTVLSTLLGLNASRIGTSIRKRREQRQAETGDTSTVMEMQTRQDREKRVCRDEEESLKHAETQTCTCETCLFPAY